MVSPSAHLGGILLSIVVSFILPSIECDLSMAQLLERVIVVCCLSAFDFMNG